MLKLFEWGCWGFGVDGEDYDGVCVLRNLYILVRFMFVKVFVGRVVSSDDLSFVFG